MDAGDHSFAKGLLLTGGGGLAIALVIAAAVWLAGRDSGGTSGHATATGAAGESAAAATSRAPAFTLSQLAAEPAEDWITNGGSLMNQRYSPLAEITTNNVASLKGVWLTHLRNSAVAAKYSAESQPLEYKGVIYVPTGEDDVFAVSVASGRILWQYKAHLDQRISTVCCGWESRGVALGDGKVYIGQLDGRLVALDQMTGRRVWSTQVGDWKQGYSITSAPLYVDGRIVTGISGGEFGIRGRVTAYDAATGKEAWRFYTIPGPGQKGHETWPAKGNAWKHGGAPVWQTPSVDPKLGLLYFSTGNAGPDNDGSHRAGDNLYAASIVAVDARDGTYKWHYQMVHHDIWDYDAPSPTVLFDATINGRVVHGIGEAEKTGWLYLLDRTNGKPIFPSPEKAVPQNTHQKTAKTQPFPSYPPYVPHVPSRVQVAAVKKALKAVAKQGASPPKVIVAKSMYTPYWKTVTVLTPGPQGGTNWQPSSYDPQTHMFYVCAQSGITGDTAETKQPAKQKKGGAVQTTLGSTLTLGGGFGQNVGSFTAIDATTGRIVWQKHWPESCYASSTATAGGLVFIGRSTGVLLAFDARTGKQLWSFQTGAGANNGPTIFRHDGKQYLVFYAGGNALAASAHGDRLWLFGLDGKLGQARPPGAGAGVGHAGETPGTNGSTAGDAGAGRGVFSDNCSSCHGLSGQGGNGGPDLRSRPGAQNVKRVEAQVTNGGGGMPAFKGTLTPKQIRDVAAYVVSKIAKKK
jgi:alcohol dehydrogenase (cytochrome c)